MAEEGMRFNRGLFDKLLEYLLPLEWRYRLEEPEKSENENSLEYSKRSTFVAHVTKDSSGMLVAWRISASLQVFGDNSGMVEFYRMV